MKGNPMTDEIVDGEIREIEKVDAPALSLLNKSELESQLDAAHRYPRSLQRFQKEALSFATLNRQVAESCIYAIPRDGKVISGPSVRLAEICITAYGNIHAAARVLEAEERHIVAMGIVWDIEKNVRVAIEVKRRITGKGGRRFGDDMIAVTGAAAASIAYRNAAFKVIPRALVDHIYTSVREAAVGNASTLADRRKEVVTRLQKLGVPVERIWPRIGKRGIEDVGLEELEVLIGLGTSIKNKEIQIDEAFPEPDTTAEKAKALEEQLAKEMSK